ncbi:MAG: SDH family Clp fold serine proteinase, partial [Nitrososphaerales archaeon]
MNDPKTISINVLSEIQNDPPYHQTLIREIEGITKRNLICYIANLEHPAGSMWPNDDEFLEVVLRGVDLEKYEHKIDFLLSSNGGAPEVADRLCSTLKSFTKELRVIVPKSAMSAATLLSFGANSLVLGETSQVGPIDPQMLLKERELVPANTIIQAYNRLLTDLDETPRDSPKIAGLLQQLNFIDPFLVQSSLKAREVAKKLANTLLQNGLLKDESEEFIKETIEKFIEHGETLTHGTAIRYPLLKQWGFKKIELMQKDDKLWELIWKLYVKCERYVAGHNFTKYFSSRANGVQSQIIFQKNLYTKTYTQL